MPFDVPSYCTTLLEQLSPWLTGGSGTPLPDSDLPWREWLARYFPHVCKHPFGPRHVRLWEWIDAIAAGRRPRPRVEVWPRGGAKSTSGELGCARVGAKLTRRFVLYVSETQEQADKHVQAVSSWLEALGVDRSVNKFGSARAWRRDQLRTANGFNVAGLGLDTAARGIKLDEFRPDLILFDDVDGEHDTARTVEKKITSITTKILPAGSSDCGTLFLQNLIHEDGIVAQLVDGRADFLRDREVPAVEPAVIGLLTEIVKRADGAGVYRVIGGTATWEGQSLAICESQINEWGLAAFLREAQHEVAGADGVFFDVSALQYVDAADVPDDLMLCRAWDLAATAGGGDWTAGVLLGAARNGAVYVLDVERGQLGSDRVRDLLLRTAERDRARWRSVTIRLPQDPGQAGKDQAFQLERLLVGHVVAVASVSGAKWTRARGLQAKVNSGNVHMVRAQWNFAFRDELRKFREGAHDQTDDQVDAGSDAYNELFDGGPGAGMMIEPAPLDFRTPRRVNPWSDDDGDVDRGPGGFREDERW